MERITPWRAYSRKQGESVTRSDQRRRELKRENSSPPLARLRESNGAVVRWVFNGTGQIAIAMAFRHGGLGEPNPPVWDSCFANYTTPPALLAPRHGIALDPNDGRSKLAVFRFLEPV